MHVFTAVPADAGLLSFIGSALLTLGVMFVIASLATGLCTWLVVRRLRRSSQLKRLRLKARRFTSDRTKSRLALLRLQLHDSLDATLNQVSAAHAAGQPVGELPAVTKRLRKSAEVLDRRLMLAGREPDPAARQLAVAELSDHVHELDRRATEVRRALAASSAGPLGEEIRQVGLSLGAESAALQEWHRTYAALGRPYTAAQYYTATRPVETVERRIRP